MRLKSLARFLCAQLVGDAKARARQFAKIANDEPKSHAALLWAAREAWLINDPDAAFAFAAQGIALDPDSASLQLLVIAAKVHAERDQAELAYSYAKRLVNPERIDVKTVRICRVALFPLLLIPRFRHRFESTSRRIVTDFDESVAWARGYLRWFETERATR